MILTVSLVYHTGRDRRLTLWYWLCHLCITQDKTAAWRCGRYNKAAESLFSGKPKGDNWSRPSQRLWDVFGGNLPHTVGAKQRQGKRCVGRECRALWREAGGGIVGDGRVWRGRPETKCSSQGLCAQVSNGRIGLLVWLIGLRVDRFTGWYVYWLIGLLVDRFTGWLVYWLIGLLIDLFIDW